MTPPPEPIVDAIGLTRVFDEGGGVRDLDLAVPERVIFGIVGPSGSGKTTLVRLLLGIDTPDSGHLLVLGLRPDRFTRDERTRIGYLPQATTLYPGLSLRHNLDLMASLYGLPWRARFWPGRKGRAARRRIDETLDFVALRDQQDTKLRDASGGEKRRLGLAASLIHDPELLVLDEPTAGIDPLLRRDIWQRLNDLRAEGRTIVVTTQYVDEAANCDLVAFLAEGSTLILGTPDELQHAAFGDDVPDGVTFDDVFVRLLLQHRARPLGGSHG
jgi:ABC-2 type transport system ATP-binding protein